MTSETHNRIDLAVEQLDVALGLFLEQRSYVAALTLAGAAEEILGKALQFKGAENIVQYRFKALAPVHDVFHREPLVWKDFVNDENHPRNSAKHFDSPTKPTVDLDLENAALWMLVRACANFDRLNLPRTERMHEFNDWFFENVVGI